MTILRRLPVLVLVFLVWVPPAFGWSRPVEGPVLQPYVYDESHPYAAGQHRGIDIGADSAGDPVVAPAAGTVAFAGSVPTSGECVTIETADGYSVTLTHLGSIGVKKGATVAEGDVVGTVGPSGTPEVDGPYVHLGIRLTADPLGYVDPAGLLPALAPPVPPAPAHDPGSARTSAPSAATPPPPAPPAPTDSTAPPPDEPAAPAPDEPAAPADPVPASPSPEPAEGDPSSDTGDPQPVRRGGRPAPAPRAPAASVDFAELPGSADRSGDGEAGDGDSADPGSAGQAGDPATAPVEAAPRRAPAPAGRVSGAVEQLPVETERTWTNARLRTSRSRVAEPAASRLQRRATPSLLSVALGAGPGLLALVAALAVLLGRARRHAAESLAAGALVVHLPRRREEPIERRAA